jgi:predicted RNase H-like nuclease (RuvC/YqgF family)
MIDFGAVTTALGTLIGAVMTGLVTWRTMQKEAKKEDSEQTLTHEAQHFKEEREWRSELSEENERLRVRAEKKLATIEQLLDEKHKLRQEITDKDIKIKELEHLIKNLRQIIEQYKELVKRNDTTTGREQSIGEAPLESSSNSDGERTL